MRKALLILPVLAACQPTSSQPADSARAAFARVDSLLLDTQLHEISGVIMVTVPNPVIGDESPLADQPFRVGRDPEVLVFGHRHGEALFVPVKLFARQYGAFVDIGCTLANCGFIWPKPVIEHMKHINFINGTGMLEGYAEGIVTGVNVRTLRTG